MQRRIKCTLLLVFFVIGIPLFAEDVSYEDFELTYYLREKSESLDVTSIRLTHKGEQVLRYTNDEWNDITTVEPNTPFRITVYERKGIFDSIQMLSKKKDGETWIRRIIIEDGKLVFTTRGKTIACDG